MLDNNLTSTPILYGEIQRQVLNLGKEEQHKVVEPQREDVEVLPDSLRYALGSVLVKGVTANIDENIKPENIKLGATILGVQGNVAPDKPDQEKTIYPSEEEQIVVADNGFELAKVIAKPVETESFEITPSTSEQVVKASDGKYIKEVKVGAIEDIDEEVTIQEEKLETLMGEVEDLPVELPSQDKVVTPSNEQQTIVADEGYKLGSVVVEAQASYGEDLTEQKSMLADLEEDVNALKDISDETLNITENGEYNVVDYGKVVVNVGRKEIAIPLPEDFGNPSQMKSFVADDNTILLSGTSSAMSNWSYKIKENTFTKLNNSGYSFSVFTKVSDNIVLVTASITNNPTFVYDIEKNEITNSSEVGPYSNMYNVGNKWLLFGGSSSVGTALYNPEDNSFKKIDDIYALGYPFKISNKYLFSSLNGSQAIYSLGIYCYNPTDETIKQVYDKGYRYQYAQQVGEYILFSSSMSGGEGIISYSSIDDTTTQLYDSLLNWRKFSVVDNYCLVYSDSARQLFLFNGNDNTLLLVSEKYYDSITPVGDKWIMCNNTNTGGYGVTTYNPYTNELANYIPGGSYRYNRIDQVSENKYLIGSSSSVTDFIIYNLLDDTFKKCGSTTGRYNQIIEINNGVLIAEFVRNSYSTTNTSIIMIDLDNNTSSRKYSNACITTYQKMESNVLFAYGNITSSSNCLGVLLYDDNTKTITKKIAGGNYDTFIVEGNNCYIEHSSKSSDNARFKCFYKGDDATIKLIGFYV